MDEELLEEELFNQVEELKQIAEEKGIPLVALFVVIIDNWLEVYRESKKN